MPTVGRNDPCPCGSGRKYKQCCLPKDRAAQARQVGLRRNDEYLWARLIAYAQRPTFSVDLQSAFSRFWNGDFDLEAGEGLEREFIEPFLEWYIYDYHTSKDRRRIIDLFVVEEKPRLSPEQRVLLAEREGAYLSLYGIEAVEANGHLQVGDLLAGGFCDVEDPGLARLAMPGDLLLGRRLGETAWNYMSRGTVLLPSTLGPGLVATAKRSFSAYREEHYQAGWPEFLREAGYVMFHYLYTPEAAEAYAQAPQRKGYYDPHTALESMQAIMQRRAEEAARKAEAEEREADEKEPLAGPPIERTTGGILIPGQSKPAASGSGGLLLPGHLHKQ